jgi:hypothetical protein
MCNPTNAANNEAVEEMEHHDTPPFWTESALDWFQRCATTHHVRVEPQDPVSAARSFVLGETTGVAFLDEALASSSGTKGESSSGSMLEISGSPSHMATETLLSLAARFVVATRPSKFGLNSIATAAASPQVVLIDSLHNVSIERLVSMVRGMLLLDTSTSTTATTADVDPALLDSELEDCLTRIHIVLVHDTTTAVAALEALKQHGSNSSMLLWDGFLSTSPDATARMEVLRQLGRLWRERSTTGSESFILIALASNRPRLENKHVTRRIRLLEQQGNASEQRYRATVGSKLFDFTIGAAGVLSL